MDTVTVRARWTVVGVLAGLLNANFVLEHLLPGVRDVAISGLSVRGQPWSTAFRVGDGLSGVLVALLGAALLRSGRRPRRRRVAAVLVLAAGVTTWVSAVVPLSCAATVSPACAGSSPGATAPLANLVHDGVSIAGTTAAIVAAALLASATTTRERVAHALALAAAAGLGLALVVGAHGTVPGWFGAVQRAQVVVLSVWFAAVGRSVDVLARRRGSTMGS